MIKKRFTQKDEDDWEILDRGKHFAYAHSGYQAEKIIDELNELVDTNRELYKENEQLKQTNQELYDKLQETMSYKSLKMGEVSILEREIEQLKQSNRSTLREFEKGVKKVQKLAKENEELKQTIDTICKDYENHHGMGIRNADWFTAW